MYLIVEGVISRFLDLWFTSENSNRSKYCDRLKLLNEDERFYTLYTLIVQEAGTNFLAIHIFTHGTLLGPLPQQLGTRG